MTAINYIESVKCLPILTANAKLEEICGVQHFFEHPQDIFFSNTHSRHQETSKTKDEYGDWQTNIELALSVCRLLKGTGANPKIIIEPTCGKGHFILAALQVFDNIEEIHGIEIYKPYLDELKIQILQHCIDNPNKRKVKVHLYHQNVFDFDFTAIKHSLKGKTVLVLGNPPWVTNSKLGSINSCNLPHKTNFKRLSGLEAITGKSNFDIAEYICHQMIDLLTGEKASLALLLKNSVIKNIVYGQHYMPSAISDIRQYTIDAKKEFDASVAASLFYCSIEQAKKERRCIVRNFYTQQYDHEYGWIKDCFVADVETYKKHAQIDGQSPLIWWSGVKHDCAKVMELHFDGQKYINGLGEIVDIENELIFPFLKSSDLKGEIIAATRKYVIVTQQSTSDNTEWISVKYPKTYQYLLAHAHFLDNRGSRIYKGRPRFCIFGIGKYSFKPYKVAVSGLYKHHHFTIIPPIAGKSVMLDDTCYILGLENLEDARTTQALLNCSPVQSFLNSLVFTDAKRVINKELLMRIDLIKALELSDMNIDKQEAQRYAAMLKASVTPKQLSLF